MNIDISQALKAPNSKFDSKANIKEDKGQSFLKSFNKLLEDKKMLDKKRSKANVKEKTQAENEESEKVKGLREYLNTEYKINSLPQEKPLDGEVSAKSIESILAAHGEKTGDIFGQEVDLDGMSPKLAGELQNLNGDGELVKSLIETDSNEASKVENLNFSIQEAKANLSKALEGEAEDPKLGQTKLLDGENLKEFKGQETDKSLESSKNLEEKNPLIYKDNLTAKAKAPEDNAPKVETNSGTNPITNLTNVEDASEDKLGELDIEDLNLVKEDKVSEKDTGKLVETKATIEEPKAIDTNILFNRIQNSMLGPEQEEVLSPQNIQSVEDSMIKFMKVSKEGDSTIMRVKLYPEELGSIDISLKMDKGKLIADIVVASESIKEMFLNGSNLLNKNLIEQNVPIKNINIRVQDAFDSFETSNGESGNSGGKEEGRQASNPKGSSSNRLNNNPIDNMRIGNINRTNMVNKSLDILA